MSIDYAAVDKPDHQLAVELRRRITTGEYPAGTYLPDREDLADEFGVGTTIVYLAVLPLVDDDLLTHQPGIGLLVTPFPKLLPMA